MNSEDVHHDEVRNIQSKTSLAIECHYYTTISI